MEEMTLMETFNLLSTLLSDGDSIASIFGGGGPDFQAMIDKLKLELEHVFLQDLTDAAVFTATAVAQSASDLLSVDYLDGVQAGQTPAQLYQLLDDPARGVGALDQQAGIMEQWAKDSPKAIAQQTASLALTIHGLIIALYKAMADNAPDVPSKTAKEADMRAYAKLAVERVKPLYDSVWSARFSGISSIFQELGRGGDGEIYEFYYVTDTWFPVEDESRPYAVLATDQGDGESNSANAFIQITGALTTYQNLLRSGTDEDATAFQNALGNAFTGEHLGSGAPDAQGLIDQIPSFQTTGKWISQAPVALNNLSNIANSPALGAPIPIDDQAYGVILTRDGSRAYVASEGLVYVVDTRLFTSQPFPSMVGTLFGSQPQMMLLSPDESRLYVIGPQASSTPDPFPAPPEPSSYIIAMFDTDSMAPAPPIALEFLSPIGSAALSPDGKELYLTNFRMGWTQNQILLVYDTATFAHPKFLDTGGVVSFPWGVSVGPDGTAYCLNPAQTVSGLNAAGTGFTELFATTEIPVCAVFSAGQTHITLGESFGNTATFVVETYDLNPPHTRLATKTFPVASPINSRQPIVAASDGFWLLLADGQLRKLDRDSLAVDSSQSIATPVIDFAVSADGATIAVLSAAGLSIIGTTLTLQRTSAFVERALRDAESLS